MKFGRACFREGRCVFPDSVVNQDEIDLAENVEKLIISKDEKVKVLKTHEIEGFDPGVLNDRSDFKAFIDYHERRLKNRVYMEAFQKAIYNNKHLFKDKIVLDVHCGVGILSMFAAHAGAARVIGIEHSNIAYVAKRIIKDNDCDNVVKIIKGHVDEIELPDGINEVDIIVSNWIGSCVLYDSCVDAVIFARDRWLKKDGFIFPDKVRLYIAGISDLAQKHANIEYWNNVYGFQMGTLRTEALSRPRCMSVSTEQLITTPYLLYEIDVNSIQKCNLLFNSHFMLFADFGNKVNLRKILLDAYVLYFDVEFSACNPTIEFSTSPSSQYTFWRQLKCYTKRIFEMSANDCIRGCFRLLEYGNDSCGQMKIQITTNNMGFSTTDSYIT